jgi:ATP-binding protein involved in chromosome partitioning
MDRIDEVLDALTQVVDPGSGQDVVRLNLIRDLVVDGSTVRFTVVVDDPGSPFSRGVAGACQAAIQRALGAGIQVDVSMDNHVIGLGDDLQVDGAAEQALLPGVHNVIAVASGKGGVGKSTVAVNLAVSLARSGFSVGLVDMDMYGPSVPLMMGVEGAKPRVDENRHILPVDAHGVKVLSMGFLVDPDRAVIWRGPMVSSAVRQFLAEAAWGDLDYLVMDLPPGTGDIQLTIVQTVPLSGAVVVSTPQRVALADARKGVAMFEQVDVPVLGIIENMAWFETPELPGRRFHIFGEGGARSLSEEIGVPFLGQLPIEESLREACDEGVPVAATGVGSSAAAFAEIAGRVVRASARRNAIRPATQPIEILHR